MQISKTNKGLIVITALAVVTYIAVNKFKKLTTLEKRLGDSCKEIGSPEGKVVYDFVLSGMKATNNPPPDFYCRRCNPTGCSQVKLTV